MDRPPPGQARTNVFEEVMVDYLLPLAVKVRRRHGSTDEWWEHTRPIQAYLGRTLVQDRPPSLTVPDRRYSRRSDHYAGLDTGFREERPTVWVECNVEQ
jgi:hypothetical protein